MKENELKEKHTQELALVTSCEQSVPIQQEENEDTETTKQDKTAANTKDAQEEEDEEKKKVEKKRQKNILKKQQAREAMKKKELEVQNELVNTGPSARELELSRLKELYLDPNHLEIVEVPADGHCLFRAIAEQLNNELTMDDDDDDYEHVLMDYRILREKCADELALHQDTFAPFCEFDDSFSNYVERIRTSADAWGGHVELRALSQALHRPIIVYSASAPPLVMTGILDEGADTTRQQKSPLRVSYHKDFYALGEHYNSVVSRTQT